MWANHHNLTFYKKNMEIFTDTKQRLEKGTHIRKLPLKLRSHQTEHLVYAPLALNI